MRLVNVRLAAGATSGGISRQQFEDWTAELGQILTDRSDSLPARRLLAELLARTGRHSQASAVLGELYEENLGLPDLAKGYVLELIQSGEYASAQTVLENNPIFQQDLQARQWLLQVLDEQGRWEDAGRHLRHWLTTSIDKVFGDFCRLQLLNVYEKLRDFPAAQRQIDELLAGNPPPPILLELQVARVRLLCLEGKIDQAVDLAKTWTDRKDKTLTLKLALVGVLADAKQDERAQGLLDEWIRRGDAGEEQDVLAESKILLFTRAGQSEVVQAYARAWIARCPAALAPRQAMIGALIDTADYDQAVKLVDNSLAGIDSLALSATTPTRPAGSTSKTTQPSQSAPASQPALECAATGPTQPASTLTASTSQAAGTTRPAPKSFGACPLLSRPRLENWRP